MSLYDFQAAQRLRTADEPFYALIMAAMMKADSTNITLLRRVYPATWAELDARYHSGGGRIPGDPDYEAIQAEREALGMPPT